MTRRQHDEITAALNELERQGFDVKALWREFGARIDAEQKEMNRFAPLETLDQPLDLYLADAQKPWIALRQRELALRAEVERLSLEFDRLEQRALSTKLGRDKRKQIDSHMKATGRRLADRREALRDTLAFMGNRRAMTTLTRKNA